MVAGQTVLARASQRSCARGGRIPPLAASDGWRCSTCSDVDTMLSHGISCCRCCPVEQTRCWTVVARVFAPWMDSRPVVTQIEYDQHASEVASRLVDDAGAEPERLAVLVERVGDLSQVARATLQASLVAAADSDPGEDIRSAVWPALRQMISRHRYFSDTGWALPEIELVAFEALIEPLCPSAPLNAYGLLFGGGFGDIDGISPRDHEAYAEALAARRVEAVEAILDTHGLGAVLEFAAAVNHPYEVGVALATIGTDFDRDVLAAMNSAPEPVTQAALGYFCRRFSEYGWDGIGRLIERDSLPAQVTADLFRAIPAMQQPWREVNKLGGDLAAEYWARADYWYVGPPPSLTGALEVSRCLRAAGRADLASSQLATQSHALGSEPQFAEEVAACLEERVEQEDQQEPRTQFAGRLQPDPPDGGTGPPSRAPCLRTRRGDRVVLFPGAAV